MARCLGIDRDVERLVSLTDMSVVVNASEALLSGEVDIACDAVHAEAIRLAEMSVVFTIGFIEPLLLTLAALRASGTHAGDGAVS